MKIKLDENLPLPPVLRELGHDVHTINEEGLSGCHDWQVWDAAQRENRFLITQDLDFSDVRHFIPGTHSGILLIRLQSPSWRALTERLSLIFRTENVEEWKTCFVVVTEQKIRVRRPQSG